MDILDLLYPRKCLDCGRPGRYLCSRCVKAVPYGWSVCVVCKRPTVLGRTHLECMNKSPFEGIFSIWSYERVLKKALLALKYKFATDIARELAEVSVDKLRVLAVLPRNALFVPVPLSKSRERWRGFNQTEEVGKFISKRMEWDFSPQYIKRIKNSQAQAKVKKEERGKNIRGVFTVSEIGNVSKSVILFDDILTTGSTLMEAGSELKRKGVNSIWGLTLVN